MTFIKKKIITEKVYISSNKILILLHNNIDNKNTYCKKNICRVLFIKNLGCNEKKDGVNQGRYNRI